MLPRSVVRLLVVGAISLAMTGPAPTLAGGGGLPAVELDEPPPSEIFVGQPVTVEFMVMGHGTPMTDTEAYLSALHKESKESFEADALVDRASGRFSAEAIFHEIGTWFWEIVLPEFGTSTTLAPVTVLAAGASSAVAPAVVFSPETTLPATIQTGTCAQPGESVADLEALGTAGAGAEIVGVRDATPVKTSVTTIDAALSNLVADEHVLAIASTDDAAAGTWLACGEIGGRVAGAILIIGLRGTDDSGYSGIAVLEEKGAQTTVTTYLTQGASPGPATAGSATGKTVTLDIEGSAFSVASLIVEAGDTVTWTNRDPVVHTVSFEEMAIGDSPPLEQGDEFSITFDTPGTYSYICNPHPFMTGMVVVRSSIVDRR